MQAKLFGWLANSLAILIFSSCRVLASDKATCSSGSCTNDYNSMIQSMVHTGYNSLNDKALPSVPTDKGTTLFEASAGVQQKTRWEDLLQRRYPGHAYIDKIKCWAAFAENHKLPWVVLHGAMLHWTRAPTKEHVAWDPDIDILTTEAAQYLVREEFRGKKYGFGTGVVTAGSEVLGPNLANCRDMKKQYGLDEINMGPTFGRVGSKKGWVEFWSANNESALVKKFYSNYDTDIFANRRAVQYNFRQDDGKLASVPIYLPAKDYADFAIKFHYQGGNKPLFNQWTGQHWISNDTVWRLYEDGKGPYIDYGIEDAKH